jgi:hypoxanthine-DNA glycosylase
VNIEAHAFGSYIPPDAETLIIGTFPTHKRNWEFEFFYPNRNNVFWKIISNLFDYTFHYHSGLEAAEERKLIATSNKIALTDMLAKAIRERDNSGDEQLIKVELMDILAILKSTPSIRRIILTSRSGKINALQLFKQHLSENKLALYESKERNLISGYFEFDKRKVQVFVPYSPSPRVERQHGFDLISTMYRQCFKK